MPIIHITDPADSRIADYRNVPDPELLRGRGMFVAENRLVVRALLASTRFRTRSVLVTDAAYESLRDVLDPQATARVVSGASGLDVYVCPKSLVEPISGYHIHRGCLALGERPAPVFVPELLAALSDARRLLAMEAVTNADNVGAIFRNARAFGVDGIVVGPRCCDPLYRKAVRVSIGATLLVPFAAAPDFSHDLLALRHAGFTLAALTPALDAIDLNEFAARPPERLVLLVGNEGEGLSADAVAAADVRIRIAMAPGVDSLNASTATGIALHGVFRE